MHQAFSRQKLQELLSTGREVARQAASLLQINQAQSRIAESEIGKDIKIQADRLLNAFISERLTKLSNLPVISEESDKNFEFLESGIPLWIIDPLDGSKNFSRGLDLCCISIALWERGNPVLGIIYDFHRDKMYSGGADIGAWMNKRPIYVSKIDRPERAILATGFPVMSDFSRESVSRFIASVQRFMKIRMLGTAALSLSWVASGCVDVYYERDIMTWDVAAGLAIVRAAGGAFRMEAGRYSKSHHVIATNRELLPKIDIMLGLM